MGRAVRGWGSGRPGERWAQMRSIRATVSSSRGTIRSVVELAQRHLQPGPLAGDLVHAVELEVEQLTDAQPAWRGPAAARRRPAGRGEPCSAVMSRRSSVRGQVARQRAGQFRDVAAEHQPPGRCLGPAPLGDVGEQASAPRAPERAARRPMIGAPVCELTAAAVALR